MSLDSTKPRGIARGIIWSSSRSLIRSGSYLHKKSKTKKIAVILRLAHDLSVLEKLNFASLFLEIQDLPTIRFSCFLDQFISTFSAGNHSVKFQDLKISTEHSPCKLF